MDLMNVQDDKFPTRTCTSQMAHQDYLEKMAHQDYLEFKNFSHTSRCKWNIYITLYLEVLVFL